MDENGKLPAFQDEIGSLETGNLREWQKTERISGETGSN